MAGAWDVYNSVGSPINYMGSNLSRSPTSGITAQQLAALQAQIAQLSAFSNQPSAKNPFTSAMSGTEKGTLQPYINNQTQQASNALYGGLLNYQPQQLQAGSAGGQAMPSQVPQGFNLPSAIPQGGDGLLGQFGKRSWMQGA